MSTQQQQDSVGAASLDVADRSAIRRLDPLDGPARPLGRKRAALHARRTRSARDRPTANARHPLTPANGRTVASVDATLTFSIVPLRKGVLIKREHCSLLGTHIAQVMKFDCTEQFDRWCASEPVRFDDPLLFDNLCRQGHDALRNEG